ncbi:hypothetical protein H8356DRAFT_1292427 [Neocallimastix lanati (nom. inval.)]|uniref:Uncharacterized protein n=1 Tax=Neocallimastix californiae TaxID=1754190 RepID=A0A1Y2AQ74_9FUNG|nr:hypothetical protein H8356DRAFT_1292427 [Neocallimastix sp. JGI-2020a]ORY24624.1 hypothetical protein LY90DRAFT_675144 [Neocallimastix californiae]|eukprot:ORY24624.1 hypothetical protein LY90DRAFT_675144 [Neocallimastix californiae]
MASNNNKVEKKEKTISDAIFIERIKKENKYYKIYDSYTLNKNITKKLVNTEKPQCVSVQDRKLTEEVDEEYMKLIEYQNLPPNKKYILPITESQNYGWDCKVLLPETMTDPRLRFPIKSTDIRFNAECSKRSGTMAAKKKT